MKVKIQFKVMKNFTYEYYVINIPEEWLKVFFIDDDVIKVRCPTGKWVLRKYRDWGFDDHRVFSRLGAIEFYDILELIYLLMMTGFNDDNGYDNLMSNGLYTYGGFFYGYFGVNGSKIFERTLKIYES